MPIVGSFAGASARAYGANTGVLIGDFESISTTTVGAGGTSTITFSSIPQTYTHLQIRGIGATNRATYGQDDIKLTINSITSSVYSYHYLNGTNTTAGSGAASTQSSITIQGSLATGITTNVFGGLILDILDYKDTNKFKTIRYITGNESNGATAGFYPFVTLGSGSYQQTTAISSITFAPIYGTLFNQYSSFALYGVKA